MALQGGRQPEAQTRERSTSSTSGLVSGWKANQFRGQTADDCAAGYFRGRRYTGVAAHGQFSDLGPLVVTGRKYHGLGGVDRHQVTSPAVARPQNAADFYRAWIGRSDLPNLVTRWPLHCCGSRSWAPTGRVAF